MISTVIILVALIAAYSVMQVTDKRTAKQVLRDLEKEEVQEVAEKPITHRKLDGDKKTNMFLFFVFVAIVLFFKFILGMPLQMLIALGMVTGSLLFLGVRIKRSKRSEHDIDGIEYQLPIIMEQLVMAVQSGYDVFSALRIVLDTEAEAEVEKRSPMAAILLRTKSLIESGVTVEDALREVSHSVPSSALRHAFLHLAIAHKEGGELVRPLRELSDATQLYYQETVEEKIAKLPVKATLPLVITFAGLMLLFLTSPIIKMMSMTAKSTAGLM